MSEQETYDSQKQSTSARFGRRASRNEEKNRQRYLDSTQVELEKYWKGLQEFRQFHKGRLDSSSNRDNHLYYLGKQNANDKKINKNSTTLNLLV